MKQKKSSVLYRVRPDLLVLPHVVDMLFHIFLDDCQPTPLQQEQLVTHLTECSQCRTLLITLLLTEQKYEKSNGSADSLIDDLFVRFVHIHHEIESQKAELLGAYAEAIMVKGRARADRQFPTIAEHMKTCQDCQNDLEETLTFLRETEEI